MKHQIAFCVILLIASVNCKDCKSVKCPSVPKHYEEIGCTPIITSDECCPSQFDCSHLKQRDANKCHYQNKDFDVGEELHNPDIEASCTIGCRCREQGNTETAKFDCTHIDCPEFFGSPLTETRGKKCIRQYKSKSCCSSNTVCGEDLNKLAKCEVNGKTYYEGERIDTARSCYNCICGEGFENKPFEDNKHCYKINCNIELHYYKRILDGCVPIYWKRDDCCPIEWRCPNKDTTVIPDSSPKKEGKDSLLKCSFGELKMNVGDFLSPANDYDQCTICTCKLPPYPHCIKTC